MTLCCHLSRSLALIAIHAQSFDVASIKPVTVSSNEAQRILI
jgi:hypothetical protein